MQDDKVPKKNHIVEFNLSNFQIDFFKKENFQEQYYPQQKGESDSFIYQYSDDLTQKSISNIIFVSDNYSDNSNPLIYSGYSDMNSDITYNKNISETPDLSYIPKNLSDMPSLSHITKL